MGFVVNQPMRLQLTPTGQLQHRHTRRGGHPTRSWGRGGRPWRRHAHAVIATHPWCAHCGATSDLTVDHIQPIATGGDPWNPANHQVLCRTCNSRKGTHDGRSTYASPDGPVTEAHSETANSDATRTAATEVALSRRFSTPTRPGGDPESRSHGNRGLNGPLTGVVS